MNRTFEQKLTQAASPARSVGKFKIYFVLAMLAMGLAIIFGGADVAKAQPAVDTKQNRPVDVATDVSKSVVQVAEPFGLDVIVTAPAGIKVFFPAVNHQLGDFDVVEHQDVFDIPAAADSDAQRSWTRHYSLESIVTGDLEIPPIEIRFVSDANADSIATKAVPMRVVSVLEDRADPTKFRDIKSVVDVAIPEQNSNAWMFWVLGGMGAGALSVATVALVARRKKYLTPSQWAISEFDQLQTSPAMQNAEAEPVLQEMSKILRGYLELQFEIPASAQTTEEFLKFIERSKIVNFHTAKRFSQLLSMADQAKFAGLQLKQTELNQIIESAIALVDSVSTETSGGQDGIPSQVTPSQPSNDTETPK